MKIEQIYTGCIAQAAYYLESNGEAAIFDPLREVQPYIEKANKDNAKIKYIFETHFHADFVSGHLDLAKKTGGQIVYGPTAKPEFEAVIATDNQEFKVGNYTVKALHTPGHTLESTCYLLIDENAKQHGIITGDTLFIGDVGRPDLAQAMVEDLTQEKLASYLFDSLRNKIMPLSDDLIVYPSHGAGSACGKNMSKETTDTLGNQKKTNYALREDMTREEFTAELLDGLGLPPAYFPQNVMMNIQGYESLDTIIEKSFKALKPNEFETLANQAEAIVLDVRLENDYVKSHIPNSIFIGIQGNFAPWVGALIMDVKQPLLLVTPEGREQETITRLSRVGFDNVLGYLEGGITAWQEAGFEVDSMKSISPEEFTSKLSEKSIVVDARKPGEFSAEHVENALNIPLDTVNQNFSEVPKNEQFYLHCAGGYRSVIMGSILKSRGIHNFINVEKGISGIRNAGLKLTNFVCPSTIK
ncbi:glyoxylase-like metal-dependent hydrolase (beta-lactamase superfamily II)/rhodanese-related sulfurtransferase [Flavobacterium arsenatis]|uniref:Glyoxylase-like metal-dependent hydrolase (Beta-lactamase superfamily II)/rhodanese-related sulfurtransferase n=1 Tax=Flavobacterium arsenatis TaxID=1484332 RepID=A0ABU1TNI5_9FLAO|nr:MBL fold metallo-hydrolase [Flavobacterium arsenatis]MDR6967513.1 glyoxylase-like metal-dependent hydrolase (beta-lactamase superfamily II)/rhodanese-related sulfurtransferase [Flavobacterium arsenatis]